MQIIKLSPLSHTWILDLDGTLLKHNGYKIDGKDTLLDGVKEFFQKIPTEDKIIILTSREKRFSKETEKFLAENGVRYDEIIFDCPFGERIVINDDKPSGLQMGKAVCIKRDKGLKNFEFAIDETL